MWFGWCDTPPYTPVVHQIAEVAPATPQPVSAPGDSGMGNQTSDVERWRGLVSQYFTDVDHALCVIKYESGGNPTAVNATSGAAGLFQIMPFWWDAYGGNRFDPETNIALASVIQSQQGWGAWNVVNDGKC